MPNFCYLFNLEDKSCTSLEDRLVDWPSLDPGLFAWIDCNLDETALLSAALRHAGLTESELEEYREHRETPRYLHRQKVLVEWLSICCSAKDWNQRAWLLILMTDRFILTAHAGMPNAVIEARAAAEESWRSVGKTPGFVFFLLWDKMIDTFLDVLTIVDDELDEFEDSYLQGHGHRTLFQQIVSTKRNIRVLRNNLAPMHRMMRHLVVTKLDLIHEESLKYLQRLYENLEQLLGAMESLQEHGRATLEGYNSFLTQQTNKSLRILTVITTVLMPLSLIAGIYGTNFSYVPEFTWRYSYFFFWLLLGVVALVMLYILKKKRWI